MRVTTRQTIDLLNKNPNSPSGAMFSSLPPPNDPSPPKSRAPPCWAFQLLLQLRLAWPKIARVRRATLFNASNGGHLTFSWFLGSSREAVWAGHLLPLWQDYSLCICHSFLLYVCVFVMFFCNYCYISINFHCDFNIFKFKLRRGAALVQWLSFSLLLMNDGNS